MISAVGDWSAQSFIRRGTIVQGMKHITVLIAVNTLFFITDYLLSFLSKNRHAPVRQMMVMPIAIGSSGTSSIVMLSPAGS